MSKGIRTGAYRVSFAAAPLLLALLLLQLFGPFSGPLLFWEAASLAGAAPASGFLPGELTFLAVVALHVAVCGATIFLAWDLLRRTPGSGSFARWGVWVAVAAGGGVALAFLAMPTVAGSLAFGAYAEFFEATGAAPRFVRPVVGNVSPLALAIVLPTVLGVAAVAMTSAAAHAQLQLFYHIWSRRGAAQAVRFRQLHQRMKQCLYALAVVLVTSTVAASLFFHLPTGLHVAQKTPPAALIARFSDFASELSFFWGVIFSLTLAIAVGLPLVLLHATVRRALEPPFAGSALQQRKLSVDSGILTEGREQVKFFVTLLAPLCAGPISNLLQSATLL